MAGLLAGNPTNYQIMNGGLFPRKTCHLLTYEWQVFWQETPPIIKL